MSSRRNRARRRRRVRKGHRARADARSRKPRWPRSRSTRRLPRPPTPPSRQGPIAIPPPRALERRSAVAFPLSQASAPAMRPDWAGPNGIALATVPAGRGLRQSARRIGNSFAATNVRSVGASRNAAREEEPSILVAFIAGLVAILASANPVLALDKVTFGLNWLAAPEAGGEGTYAKYGLDVTIQPGRPESNDYKKIYTLQFVDKGVGVRLGRGKTAAKEIQRQRIGGQKTIGCCGRTNVALWFACGKRREHPPPDHYAPQFNCPAPGVLSRRRNRSTVRPHRPPDFESASGGKMEVKSMLARRTIACARL